MIGIDTNILVRYLTGDDPKQSPAAEKFLKKHCTAEDQGWIGVIATRNAAAGAEHTYTFDQQASKRRGFKRLKT